MEIVLSSGSKSSHGFYNLPDAMVNSKYPITARYDENSNTCIVGNKEYYIRINPNQLSLYDNDFIKMMAGMFIQNKASDSNSYGYKYLSKKLFEEKERRKTLTNVRPLTPQEKYALHKRQTGSIGYLTMIEKRRIHKEAEKQKEDDRRKAAMEALINLKRGNDKDFNNVLEQVKEINKNKDDKNKIDFIL